MYFRFFPLDHQRCSMVIASISQTNTDIIYKWAVDVSNRRKKMYNDAISFHPNVSSLPHLTMFGFALSEKTMTRFDGLNQSCLVINFYFARRVGFYIIQIYLPAVLMVITSWISLWVPRNSQPARITLCVTTILVSIRKPLGNTKELFLFQTVVTLTIQGNYMTSLPQLSYLNGAFEHQKNYDLTFFIIALDLFLLTCFIFVFCVFVEYAIVAYIGKKLKDLGEGRKRAPKGSIYHDELETTFSALLILAKMAYPSGNDISSQMLRPKRKSAQETPLGEWLTSLNSQNWLRRQFDKALAGEYDSLPSKIEAWSRALFPATFLLFNIIYWQQYYFSHHDDIEEDPGFEFLI